MSLEIDYTLVNVKQLVEHYANTVVLIATPYSTPNLATPDLADLRNIVIDLDYALARMPTQHHEALTLRGLQGLSDDEAARVLDVHKNTVPNRYKAALEWLVSALNEPPAIEPIRPLAEWRDWVLDESRAESAKREPTTRRGRPPQLSFEVDARIVSLYCAGCSQQRIAEILNEDGVPTARGGKWGRSSVQRVLDRYSVPLRPRGRPSKHSPAGAQPICDVDEILKRASR